jgi:hypothetical protein
MPEQKYRFNSELQTKFNFLKAGRNENEAKYIICKTFLSVLNKGRYDLESHINTDTHINKPRVVIIPERLLNLLLNKIQEQKNV